MFFTRNQVPFNLFKPRVTAVLRQTRVGTLQKNPSVFLVTEVLSIADQFRIISFLFLLQSLSKTFNHAGSFKEQAHGRSVQGARYFVRIMARDSSSHFAGNMATCGLKMNFYLWSLLQVSELMGTVGSG